MAARATRVLIQAGVIAVAVAAIPYKLFELERFFVPKELVLHVAALGVVVFLITRARPATTDAVDWLLAMFLAWSALSALFATNHWLAQRALGLSVSGVVLYWGARRIGEAGSYRPILVAAAFATVLAAVTGLAQAYGFEPELFSQNRAPGGTFGNRNFVAHFCAIGLPVLVYVTVTGRGSTGIVTGSIGMALVTALLVMTRTRAAWLAVATTIAVLAILVLAARPYWQAGPARGRFVRAALTAVFGAGFAIALPNQLKWRSDSPYLDSALRVADYSTGSGGGRIAQYGNSIRMALAHPVLGVGPGNWPVRYPRFAPANDRSLNDDGMTDNPWPSSDWVAFVSERGSVAAAALFGALLLLFLGALRRWSALSDPDVVLVKLALAGTITATVVVSAFDAVLLLAAPSFLFWIILGAARGAGRGAPGAASIPSPTWWRPLLIAAATTIVLSTARSTTQLVAISTVGNQATRATAWSNAATWDPGSYRIALRAAQLQAARRQCGAARVHARRAQRLFPDARAPRRILRAC